MSEVLKTFYQNQAATIIKNLTKRGMEGHYCSTMDEAKAKVLELIGEPGKSIGYGGSMTIDDTDLKQQISDAGHDLIIRESYGPEKEAQSELKARMTNADTFLMSTNAITIDGELVNIDGMGHRLSYLIYGPEQVIVIAGMNKVTPDVPSGIERVHNIASPKNTVRLNCQTPCVQTGVCAKCLGHTICCQVVVTRASMVKGRIKVVLVGEELGY